MAQATKRCPSCGYFNPDPPPNARCVSCGAKFDAVQLELSREEELARRYRQQGFSVLWFTISITIMALLTGALVVGLPMVVPIFDFEGYAGMLVSLPVWFLGGLFVGMLSPGRTLLEPVVAAFLVALPTVFVLFQGQTVKTMPLFMYLLLSALGILFAMIGAFAGERLQMGPASRAGG